MDPEEQLFGVPRLQKVLTGQHNVPLEDLQKTILESVQTFTRGASQTDDITVLLVRYRAAAQGATS
jgi:sigma-B regulation protein RsbU (phosphoserine phosphatase)